MTAKRLGLAALMLGLAAAGQTVADSADARQRRFFGTVTGPQGGESAIWGRSWRGGGDAARIGRIEGPNGGNTWFGGQRHWDAEAGIGTGSSFTRRPGGGIVTREGTLTGEGDGVFAFDGSRTGVNGRTQSLEGNWFGQGGGERSFDGTLSFANGAEAGVTRGITREDGVRTGETLVVLPNGDVVSRESSWTREGLGDFGFLSTLTGPNGGTRTWEGDFSRR